MLTDDEFHFAFILFAANIYQIIFNNKEKCKKVYYLYQNFDKSNITCINTARNNQIKSRIMMLKLFSLYIKDVSLGQKVVIPIKFC